MIELDEIVEYLDDYLAIGEISDYPGAHNGLQVENRTAVERVSAAVDACQVTIEGAAEAGSQLLLVHHGLFWGEPLPVAGVTYRRLRALFEADVALYSAHLPLDVHPEVGNNVLLARALELEVEGRFGAAEGVEGIGVWAAADLSREELAARISTVCGSAPRVIEGGPPHVRRLGIVTGGAGSLIRQAWEEGLDTFLTGEGAHHTFHEATELGLNLIYAGHYATETFGVQALAERVARRFGLEWGFLDHPTGL
ncbi:MAG: Nif3-like dinuclear metal center hexameric protein [Gemmatimonadota bacterium]